MSKLIPAALLAFLLSGCSTEMAYNAAMGARVNECTKILDNTARANCYDTATQPFDRYQQNQKDKVKD